MEISHIVMEIFKFAAMIAPSYTKPHEIFTFTWVYCWFPYFHLFLVWWIYCLSCECSDRLGEGSLQEDCCWWLTFWWPSWAVVIFRVKWRVVVRWWLCFMALVMVFWLVRFEVKHQSPPTTVFLKTNSHPDNHTRQTTDNPGFKPFTMMNVVMLFNFLSDKYFKKLSYCPKFTKPTLTFLGLKAMAFLRPSWPQELSPQE